METFQDLENLINNSDINNFQDKIRENNNDDNQITQINNTINLNLFKPTIIRIYDNSIFLQDPENKLIRHINVSVMPINKNIRIINKQTLNSIALEQLKKLSYKLTTKEEKLRFREMGVIVDDINVNNYELLVNTAFNSLKNLIAEGYEFIIKKVDLSIIIILLKKGPIVQYIDENNIIRHYVSKEGHYYPGLTNIDKITRLVNYKLKFNIDKKHPQLFLLPKKYIEKLLSKLLLLKHTSNIRPIDNGDRGICFISENKIFRLKNSTSLLIYADNYKLQNWANLCYNTGNYDNIIVVGGSKPPNFTEINLRMLKIDFLSYLKTYIDDREEWIGILRLMENINRENNFTETFIDSVVDFLGNLDRDIQSTVDFTSFMNNYQDTSIEDFNALGLKNGLEMYRERMILSRANNDDSIKYLSYIDKSNKLWLPVNDPKDSLITLSFLFKIFEDRGKLLDFIVIQDTELSELMIRGPIKNTIDSIFKEITLIYHASNLYREKYQKIPRLIIDIDNYARIYLKNKFNIELNYPASLFIDWNNNYLWIDTDYLNIIPSSKVLTEELANIEKIQINSEHNGNSLSDNPDYIATNYTANNLIQHENDSNRNANTTENDSNRNANTTENVNNRSAATEGVNSDELIIEHEEITDTEINNTDIKVLESTSSVNPLEINPRMTNKNSDNISDHNSDLHTYNNKFDDIENEDSISDDNTDQASISNNLDLPIDNKKEIENDEIENDEIENDEIENLLDNMDYTEDTDLSFDIIISNFALDFEVMNYVSYCIEYDGDKVNENDFISLMDELISVFEVLNIVYRSYSDNVNITKFNEKQMETVRILVEKGLLNILEIKRDDALVTLTEAGKELIVNQILFIKNINKSLRLSANMYIEHLTEIQDHFDKQGSLSRFVSLIGSVILLSIRSYYDQSYIDPLFLAFLSVWKDKPVFENINELLSIMDAKYISHFKYLQEQIINNNRNDKTVDIEELPRPISTKDRKYIDTDDDLGLEPIYYEKNTVMGENKIDENTAKFSEIELPFFEDKEPLQPVFVDPPKKVNKADLINKKLPKKKSSKKKIKLYEQMKTINQEISMTKRKRRYFHNKKKSKDTIGKNETKKTGNQNKNKDNKIRTIQSLKNQNNKENVNIIPENKLDINNNEHNKNNIDTSEKLKSYQNSNETIRKINQTVDNYLDEIKDILINNVSFINNSDPNNTESISEIITNNTDTSNELNRNIINNNSINKKNLPESIVIDKSDNENTVLEIIDDNENTESEIIDNNENRENYLEELENIQSIEDLKSDRDLYLLLKNNKNEILSNGYIIMNSQITEDHSLVFRNIPLHYIKINSKISSTLAEYGIIDIKSLLEADYIRDIPELTEKNIKQIVDLINDCKQIIEINNNYSKVLRKEGIKWFIEYGGFIPYDKLPEKIIFKIKFKDSVINEILKSDNKEQLLNNTFSFIQKVFDFENNSYSLISYKLKNLQKRSNPFLFINGKQYEFDLSWIYSAIEKNLPIEKVKRTLIEEFSNFYVNSKVFAMLDNNYIQW